MMFNKQNSEPPKKQGILYSIPTGKNMGPYLAKDISHENLRSFKLLTKEAQESHKSYVSMLSFAARQKEGDLTGGKHQLEVESFGESYGFNTKFMVDLRDSLGELGCMTKGLRAELGRLKEKVLAQHQSLLGSALPALQALRGRVKAYKGDQAASYSKLRGELEKMEQSFHVLGGGIKQCEAKIESCENKYHGFSEQDPI